MKWVVAIVASIGFAVVVGICVALFLMGRPDGGADAPATEAHTAVFEGAGKSGDNTVALLRKVGEETQIIAHLRKGEGVPGIGATVRVSGQRVKERGIIRLKDAWFN